MPRAAAAADVDDLWRQERREVAVLIEEGRLLEDDNKDGCLALTLVAGFVGVKSKEPVEKSPEMLSPHHYQT